jgi:hypothetical protein
MMEGFRDFVWIVIGMCILGWWGATWFNQNYASRNQVAASAYTTSDTTTDHRQWTENDRAPSQAPELVSGQSETTSCGIIHYGVIGPQGATTIGFGPDERRALGRYVIGFYKPACARNAPRPSYVPADWRPEAPPANSCLTNTQFTTHRLCMRYDSNIDDPALAGGR